MDLDIDLQVSLNTLRQSVARTFRSMNDLRSSEQLIPDGGTAYRFNTDGNQTVYRCDVRRVTTINFDRKVIRTLLYRLNQESDETSAKIDLCLVTPRLITNHCLMSMTVLRKLSSFSWKDPTSNRLDLSDCLRYDRKAGSGCRFRCR